MAQNKSKKTQTIDIDEQIQQFALDNESVLVELYFNVDSDIYDDHDPFEHMQDTLHTNEDYIEFQENFYPDLNDLHWVEFVKEVYKTLDDRCVECLNILSDESFIVITESRPGIGIGEDIVTGYECHICGASVDY